MKILIIAFIALLILLRTRERSRLRKRAAAEYLRLLPPRAPGVFDSVRFEPAIGHDAGRRINKRLTRR